MYVKHCLVSKIHENIFNDSNEGIHFIRFMRDNLHYNESKKFNQQYEATLPPKDDKQSIMEKIHVFLEYPKSSIPALVIMN